VSSSLTRADERILFDRQSAYQRVVLAEEPGGHLNLTLDDVWQFRSQDEQVFHEVLADTPMLLAPDPRRVLILGGGDGLALRNVLRYPSVELASLCELDPAVIEMTREVPEMVALSEGALADPRVEVEIADARDWIRRGDRPRYDVIICDFPAATSAALADLFAAPLFAALAELAHDQTLISIQVSQDPAGFWPVCAAVEASFAWLCPLLVNLDLDGSEGHDWADFIVASPRPQRVRREPPPATRLLRGELIERLRIRTAPRRGDVFETLEYGRVEIR